MCENCVKVYIVRWIGEEDGGEEQGDGGEKCSIN